ncbi:MAG: PilZ domain-containing protein [Candidatus Omnitrophota bacterium]|jgi:hypothetical protein
MPDKRSHVRLTLRGRVKMKSEGEPPYIFSGELGNISFRGFSVLVREKEGMVIEAGMVVQFELAADLWRKPLIGKGIIRGVTKGARYGLHGMYLGVEFLDMDRNEIMLFLGRLQSRISRDKAKKNANLVI